MSEADSQNPPSQDVATLLTTMISNPDLLSKIGEIISKHTNPENRDEAPQKSDFSENIEDSRKENNDYLSESKDYSTTTQNTGIPFGSENPLGFLSFFASEKLGSLAFKDEQIALLLAMRPYLSDHRRELIDGFVKLHKIAGIFKNISQEKN